MSLPPQRFSPIEHAGGQHPAFGSHKSTVAHSDTRSSEPSELHPKKVLPTHFFALGVHLRVSAPPSIDVVGSQTSTALIPPQWLVATASNPTNRLRFQRHELRCIASPSFDSPEVPP